MTSTERTSIFQKSSKVRQCLGELYSALENGHSCKGISSLEANDVLSKFMLWAGNLGAFRTPDSRMSLDARLSDENDLHDQICQLLDEILVASEDVLAIVHGTAPNRPVTLFRIAVLVRKSTGRDRFQQALRSSDKTFFASVDTDHVRNKYPKIRKDWLITRLGDGITKRRQFIAYCSEHRDRLAGGSKSDKSDKSVQTDSWSEVDAETAIHSSKASTFSPLQPEQLTNDVEEAMSFVSATTMATSLSGLRLPSLSELTKDGEAFECPICFTLQSFSSEKLWRIHAFRDLKAYVCTASNEGECDGKFFSDRDSWFRHELEEHRTVYKCRICQQEPFGSTDLRKHIQTVHGPFENDQLAMLQESGKEPVTIFRPRDCPFCNDWGKTLPFTEGGKGKGAIENQGNMPVSASRFKRHVASHQEQLALFAIPRALAGDLDEEKLLYESSYEPFHGPGIKSAEEIHEHLQEIDAATVETPEEFQYATHPIKPINPLFRLLRDLSYQGPVPTTMTDLQHRVHHSRDFYVGRVVLVERSEQSLLGNPTVSNRRFTIVKSWAGHSNCVPIHTYGNKGCTKKGVRSEHHGMIYTGSEPALLPGEPPLGFPAIHVVLTDPRDRLSSSSRVNYAKLSTIEHHCKMRFIGHVDEDGIQVIRDAVESLFKVG